MKISSARLKEWKIRNHFPQFRFFAGLLLVVVLFGGAGSDTDKNYTLSCSKLYSPTEKPVVQVESYHFSGSIHFRTYRIEEPISFFEQQRSVHNPDIAQLRKTSVFKILDASINKLTRDARQAARIAMPEYARNVVIGVGGIDRSSVIDGGKKDSVFFKKPKALENYPVEKEWDEFIEQGKDYWDYHDVGVDLKKPGVYLVEGRTESKVAYTIVIISEYGLITKRSDNKMYAYVINKMTGERVDGYPMKFYYDKKEIASGKSNDGIFLATLPVEERSITEEEDFFDFDYDSKLLLMGYQHGQFIISDPYYSPYEERYGRFIAYTYTERPIYRPGQEVYLKSIIRERSDEEGLLNYTQRPIGIQVTDPRDNVVFHDSLYTNDFGSINTHFLLGDEPSLGYYSIRLNVDGLFYYANFQVEEYKKPEYKVEVRMDKDQYARGDAITATIAADYFFGSPVAEAPVEYFIFRSRYWRPWWKGSDFEFYYEDDAEDLYAYRQEMIDSNEGMLDKDGRLKVTIYTDANAKVDYLYRVQANVVDASRRSISGAKSVQVTRGLFGMSLRTGKWVYQPKDKIDLNIETKDFKNVPVSAPVVVQVKRYWWDRVGYQKDNATHYHYKKQEAVITQFASRTQSNGKETVFFQAPLAGYYQVEVIATDSKGNTIDESTSVYVSDESYAAWWGDEAGSEITIIPDKSSYSPGETMHALVNLPASKMDALVSIECGDVYEVKNVHFDGTSKMIDIEIKEEYMPNIYLSVSSMYDGEFIHESKRILALPENKFLRVNILNDKQQYRPGASGNLQVKVTDGKGKPVSNAEVSLSVVDEAVYAVAPESTPDIARSFYMIRYNDVETQSSSYFNFYGYSRSLRQEEFADADLTHRNSLIASRDERAKKIAYGDVKGGQFIEPVVRKDFRDMIQWSPALVTDGNGMVRVPIKYPDNLTTWRATVRVVDRDTKVGSAISKTIVRKDLMVRMETPRFFMQNDECVIATIVHNYLNEEKKVKLNFSATNLFVEDSEQFITVPRNGHARIDWKVKANQTGQSKLLVKAMTNQESDAMELRIPTLPRGILVAEARSIDTEKKNETREEEIILPQGTDLQTAELYINASPSLATAIFNALDELIGYPYGCVEQTMSRFLPTVIVSNTLEKLGVPMAPEKKKEIPVMVAKGLKRLYGMQHNDGGWGWWTNDETNPFMTAYVIYGMSLAREAGHNVATENLQRGVKQLLQLVEKKHIDSTTKAYMLYVLALSKSQLTENEKKEVANALDAFRPTMVNNYALALLALANKEYEKKNEARSYAHLLEKNRKYQDDVVYWSGKSWHYDWQNDDVETSALALKALLQIRGDGNDVRQGVKWLLANRKGFGWESTRQTAITLLTLVDYMKVGKEMHPDYNLKIFINDKNVLTKRMTQSDVFLANGRIRIDKKYVQSGVNKIRVEKNGSGSLYFTARFLYYTPEQPIRARAAGITVQRDYFRLMKQRTGEEIIFVKQPLSEAMKSGDEVFVKLSVTLPEEQEYFLLEDPIPSGCEVIQKTDGYKIKNERGYDRDYYGYWRWWWADRDVRDEKVSFFVTRLGAGKHEFTYIMRAQIPGVFAIMPTVASLMYYPEVRGNANESKMVIR